MRRIVCVLLCLLLLCAAVSAEGEEKSLSAQVQSFLAENGLDSSNFALNYYNTDTGESYSFNQTTCFPAGSLWKLPLHMYYYEQDSLGAYDPPLEDPEYVFTIDEMTLAECHYRSIILGSDEVAEKMREQIGTYEQFKLTVNEAFGHVPEEYLPERFYAENCFSTLFWINTLQAISNQPDLYQDMTRSYNMVQTADGFASYGMSYSLIHIRGEEDGFVCDVGEISAPQTYLLACCVSLEAGGDDILAKINALICAYVEDSANVSGGSTGTFVRGDEAMTVVSANNQDKSTALRWMGIALGGAAALAAVVLLIFRLLHRDPEDYDEDDEE